ncbi:MAG: glycosyltransferase family 4 protein [Acidobacteriota bacterium]|nr:glycosyltransferase family 4 protein [Acidobacteriota bacterium]
MKILITSPNLDDRINISGISTLARQIIERGSENYIHFEAGRRDGQPADARWILWQINSVRRFWLELKRKQIDLVHLNTNYQPLAIVRDAVYAATARAADVPVLLHLHGGRFLAEEFKNPVLSRIAEKTARSSKVVLVLSELEKEIIEKRWRGLKNIRVLENGVALEDAIQIKENPREIPVLIFLGRLYESKGLHEIITACRTLKDEGFKFRFQAYGTGPLEDFFVREMTAVLGEHFHFGGIVSGKAKWQAYSEADIFVLPSRHGEGLPIAMLEAMAAGCVVVVSEMASTGAVIENGVNGFLIEPRNAAQLAGRLKYLLENRTVWEKLTKTARQTVEERFSLDVYIARLENIYREIKN